MNTTTGTDSFKATHKRQRRGSLVLLASVCCLFFQGCLSRQPANEAEQEAKTDVEVVSPVIQATSNEISFQGVTRYMQSNDIRSKITGIVVSVHCVPAQNIKVSQPLFVIQPQEAAALHQSTLSDELKNGLLDTITSHISGQVKSLNVQAGDFVQAGDILASCVRSNSMKIIAYVPVEQVSVVEKTKSCQVLLPDGTSVEARVSGKLPSAEAQDQTQAYVIEPRKDVGLAENINLSVQFITDQHQQAIMVPVSAVMGNEEQTSFWVMKLVNDSTGIKVPVQKGRTINGMVQLTGTDLTVNDRIISQGAYGLPDTARVQVIKP
ncbi:MAG: efflux RND transporter periplasmic adaptor subunit [Candidatus Saccharibacteria bacterium]